MEPAGTSATPHEGLASLPAIREPHLVGRLRAPASIVAPAPDRDGLRRRRIEAPGPAIPSPNLDHAHAGPDRTRPRRASGARGRRGGERRNGGPEEGRGAHRVVAVAPAVRRVAAAIAPAV